VSADEDGYEAARAGAAVCELPERTVLAVTGPPRQKFLHGILSNDVQALAPGRGCRAALMDVKGRQLAWMRVLMADDAVLLELPADRLALVEATMAHYRVAAPVRFAARPTSVLGLLGPAVKALLNELGFDAAPVAAEESHAAGRLAGHEVRIARAGDLPCSGHVAHVAPEDAPAVRAAVIEAGARALGRTGLDTLRIEEGRAWYGPDVTADNLLHETGLLREYHSPAKGCYVGQEVVARLEGRGGHVSRRLRGLRLRAPAAAGDVISAEGQEVGRVTSAGVSPTLGPIAMGYVHRSRSEAGAEVEVAGHPATVALLPLLQAFPPPNVGEG
jgi:folate-binding protein YgfZ